MPFQAYAKRLSEQESNRLISETFLRQAYRTNYHALARYVEQPQQILFVDFYKAYVAQLLFPPYMVERIEVLGDDLIALHGPRLDRMFRGGYKGPKSMSLYIYW